MYRPIFHGPRFGHLGDEKPSNEKPKGIRNLTIYLLRKFRTDAAKSLKTYIRLVSYSKPYLYLVIIVLFLSAAASFLSILPNQIMGLAIEEIRSAEVFRPNKGASELSSPRPDGSLTRVKSSLPIAPTVRKAADYMAKHWLPSQNPFIVTFYTLALAFLLLHLTSTGISITRAYIMTWLGQTLIFDMRNNVYQHLQKLSLKYFEDRKTGDIMSRVVNDVNSLQYVIVEPVIGLVNDILRLCWILYFCIKWNWRLTAMSLLIGPFLIPATLVFGRVIRKTFRLLRRKVGEVNALIQDNLSGIRIIKGFAREDYELNRFKDKNDENRRLYVRTGRLSAVFGSSMGILMQAGSLLVLAYGGVKVLRGDMEPGIFIVFFSYVNMLYGPLAGLTGFYNNIQQALASVERVFEVLDTEPDVADKKDAMELPVIRGEVEFRNVCFSYSGDIQALKNVSLRAYPGQMVAFVGPSGAGKTTAVNLVARFYDPTSGGIFVDGYNLQDVKQKSLRSQMGIVLQEPFLFNDTIKASIAYGKLGATDDEIIEAAKAANAHDFIIELPKGYETVIGERGVKLSGGQRQRISIARAILANPRILILDEATSSVDTETEMLIQSAIQRLVKDRTTFVIAHRLSTVHNANLIVVLDKGDVVEMGTHNELLAKDGLYSRLHKVQFRTPDSDLYREQVPESVETERPSIPEDYKVDQVVADEIAQADKWQKNSDGWKT